MPSDAPCLTLVAYARQSARPTKSGDRAIELRVNISGEASSHPWSEPDPGVSSQADVPKPAPGCLFFMSAPAHTARGPPPMPTPHTPPAGRPPLPPVPTAILLPATASRHVPVPAAPDDPARLTPDTAGRLVGVYTHPGDLIVDVGGTGVLAAAAAHAGRRATTLVTENSQTKGMQTDTGVGLASARRGVAHTLTTSVGGLAGLLAASPGTVRLLVCRLPLPGHRLTLATAGRWLAACRTALADDGYLIAAIDPTGPDGAYADHATTVIVAARALSLCYHQHLIAITQPLPDPGQPRSPLPPGARHARLHADLYVLAAPGGGRDA